MWLLCALAMAQQTRFSAAEQDGAYAFAFAWKDAAKARHEVAFEVPADEVREELALPLKFPGKAASAYVVEALKDYARDLPRGVRLEAKGDGKGGASWRVRGPAAEARAALRGARDVQEAALARFLDRHFFTTLKNGAVTFDHARIVADEADEVAPLAAALGGDDVRAFAARALSFVQTIPYEKRKNGGDRGYRRPLSLLYRNRGDCDGKAVLFLALVRARFPDVGAAVIYVPDHAYVGLAVEPRPGEAVLRHDGVAYVLAEPVGPRLVPLGEVGPKSRRPFRTQVRVVPG
ncbi:MAG: hypothetical protein ACOZNI_12170 [Myxococcota bacterium]